MSQVPDGFEPLFRSSPFLETNGPFYQQRQAEGGLIVGIRIEARHTNARGFAHGGLLLTLADVALGYNLVVSMSEPVPFVTTNLSADFASFAKIGDWVEARVDIQKVGGRAAFANAYLSVGAERIVRASAVFLVAGQNKSEQ